MPLNYSKAILYFILEIIISTALNFTYLILSEIHLALKVDFYSYSVIIGISNLLITIGIFLLIRTIQKKLITTNSKLNIILNIIAYLPFTILCLLFFITPILDTMIPSKKT
jgi:hypothetical protein